MHQRSQHWKVERHAITRRRPTQDGARFVHDDALSTIDLMDLLHLFAKMVTDDMSREHEQATRALELLLQPDFARSDRRFNSWEVL